MEHSRAVRFQSCLKKCITGYIADIHAILIKGEDEELQDLPTKLEGINDVLVECNTAGDECFQKFGDVVKLIEECTSKIQVRNEQHPEAEVDWIELSTLCQRMLKIRTGIMERIQSMIAIYCLGGPIEELAHRGESGLKTRQEGRDLSNFKKRTISRVSNYCSPISMNAHLYKGAVISDFPLIIAFSQGSNIYRPLL